MSPPTPLVTPPMALTAGPVTAAIPPILIRKSWVSGSNCSNFSMRSAIFSTKVTMWGSSLLPNSIPTSLIRFWDICIWDSDDSYLFSASSINAELSSHAWDPVCRASVRTSKPPAALSVASLILSSVMLISSSATIALPPSSSILDSPPKNNVNALPASSSNARLNSAVLTPAIFEKLVKSLFPVSTPTVIRLISLENALPPASASKPNEVNPVANPRMSASDNPAAVPAAANRSDILTISDSIAA